MTIRLLVFIQMVQMIMSVRTDHMIVMPMQTAPIMWVASSAVVWMDLEEMEDSTAQVSTNVDAHFIWELNL